MKKILFYEAMPDILKAQNICALAQHEIKKGNEVFLIVEEEVQLLTRNSHTAPHTVCCRKVIGSIVAASGINYYALPRNKEFALKFAKDPSSTMDLIRDYRFKAYEKIVANFKPELIVIWNGLAHYQQDFLSLSQRLNHCQAYRYVEAGWFPQKGTFYTDSLGVNAKSSIAKEKKAKLSPLENEKIEAWKSNYRRTNGNYKIKDKNYIFIPLQLETDTNITNFSPFKKMQDFLAWVETMTPKEYSIIARPHPLSKGSLPLNANEISSRLLIDSETNIHKLISECSFVVGINSTVLLEALIYEKQVYAVGEGLFDSSKAIRKQKVNQSIDTNTTLDIASANILLSTLVSTQKKLPNYSIKSPILSLPYLLTHLFKTYIKVVDIFKVSFKLFKF
ncbi:hypothetical protein ACJJIR_07760 [Microbulbifer sp. SSSA008]|uniref:capsular polysaccharide export protein, LipB/KpsS family n=1 Tax=Microbulbifer sp. SSSA008 TaxID=3243380 RepID=UPI004039783C